MMKKLIWISTILLVGLASCEEEKITNGECDNIIVVDELGAIISDPYMITSVQLEGSCLAIEVSSGGCSGESWAARLFASSLVAESYPPQVSIELSFDDDELCEAAIKRTFSFNLEALNNISDQMILHLAGWDEPIYYGAAVVAGEWSLVNINGGLTGLNSNFEKGDITWDFDEETVTIANALDGNDDYSGFESGVYDYSIELIELTPYLTIDEINIGAIYEAKADTLIFDYRAADGFQYVLVR